MPGPTRRGGRRTAIPTWRVKAGKREVFAGTKAAHAAYTRKHPKADGVKTRLVPPNK